MATHSSVLAWRVPGTGEPGGLPSMGSHRVRHDWSDLAAAATGQDDSILIPWTNISWGGGRGNSLQVQILDLVLPPWILWPTLGLGAKTLQVLQHGKKKKKKVRKQINKTQTKEQKQTSSNNNKKQRMQKTREQSNKRTLKWKQTKKQN